MAKSKRTFCCLALSGISLWAGLSLPQDGDVEMVRQMKQPLDGHFSCREMVYVVNHLRRLGKNRALEVLADDDDRHVGDNQKVILICHLLFTNPEGWKPLNLGIVSPSVADNVNSKFPLFPLAISKGVPFILITGYTGCGRGELAYNCILQCRRFPMVQEDLCATNYEKAAKALIRSDEFKWDIYAPHNNMVFMSEEIMQQARRESIVTDHFKTSQPGSNQNRPL